MRMGFAFPVVAVLVGEAGFAVHGLWWIALFLAVVWILGFVIRPGEQAYWYRW